MSLPHARSGEVIALAASEPLANLKTSTLVCTDGLEVIRLIIPAGKQIPSHSAPGPITVQCLQGRIRFDAPAGKVELSAGQILYLDAHEPHALVGIEDSSVLVTIRLASKANRPPLDVVQEASEESFPASDAPAY